MKIPEILTQKSHRPFPVQRGSWRYYQEWNRALFLHWRVPVAELSAFVPSALEVDLFDSEAWVSLVAFTMENVRPRGVPAISAVSDFHEINIRTYVKCKGKAGVYFLSIEAGKRVSCFIARHLSALPYRYSEMSRNEGKFHSLNRKFRDSFLAEYRPGNGLLLPNDRDKWLTERYALFQEQGSRINMYDIHHVEWPLQLPEILDLWVNYKRFPFIHERKPDLCHYSPGVQVLAWPRGVLGKE
jgi:uncharacterized protein